MIYSSAFLYQLCMRLLYNRNFEERYVSVANEIPYGAQVLDLCCGDCRIYRKYLKSKNVNYTGLDISKKFGVYALKRGISFQVADLTQCEIPEAEYIIMMASVYQFFQKSEELLQVLLRKTRKKLIITEPILNYAKSGNPFISKLAKFLTHTSERFDLESFQSLIQPHQALVEKREIIANGREMLVVFNMRSKI